MSQSVGRQGGHISISTDAVVVIDGKFCNGFRVDLEKMTLTPVYEGLPMAPDMPLKPMANTVEYIILTRGDNGQDVKESKFTAIF